MPHSADMAARALKIEECPAAAAHTFRATEIRLPRGRRSPVRELVERAARGETAAFEVLIRRSSDRLYAIAYRILRDQYLAEDAVQQVLVTIWDELPRLRDPDRFEAWTYRLVVRAAVAEARRERRGTKVQLLPDDNDASPAPDDYRAVADRDQLERGFRRLTPEQRAVLVMQHYAGM